MKKLLLALVCTAVPLAPAGARTLPLGEAASRRFEEASLGEAASRRFIGTTPVDLVRPLMGTDNTKELSCGNLYPAICRPWGMNVWTPQTGKMGNGWIYLYADRRIRGLRQTHQPSPWIGDYGQFAVMPITGKTVFKEDERASWFSHKIEHASPATYRVYLAEHDVTVELAPTERAAIFRVTYPETDTAQFVVDAFDEGSAIQVDTARRRVSGWSSKRNVRGNERDDPPRVLRTWFVLEFDHPFAAAPVWADGTFREGQTACEAKHAGVVVRFAPTKRGEQVHVRVASSFISAEQAERNLLELGEGNFAVIAARGRAAWNEVLGRIRVEGGTEDQQRTFYTCLYRALLFPRRFFEIGADGAPMHRSPMTGEVRPGVYFCDTGFWDTFRSLFPLLNFLYPEMNAQMMKGLEACYDECGWLPEWSSPGLRHCMIGNNSASVVADAWLTGAAKGCDIQKLYQALLHGANAVHPKNVHVGRLGFEAYNEKGWVPRDVGIRESAARTLEYAYDDWCIWRLGVALGRPKEETDLYLARSRNWRNVFSPEHRLACGRAADGTFNPTFNKFTWGGDFTEGNSLHYTWSVFHDIAGLMEAMGGRDAFNAQLDDVFGLPPVFDGAYYNGMTHEIREMQVVNFGQYAHGNQPVQHAIYLYAWGGQPWKTQYWVKEARDRLYHPTPDGYCGDEDNGQTSAWYVWSSLGFYPVCPGSGEYVLGAPAFPKITVTLPGGPPLVITAVATSCDTPLGEAASRRFEKSPLGEAASRRFEKSPLGEAASRRFEVTDNRYVQKLMFNGAAYDKNYLKLDDLRAGGTLAFEMSSTPNTSRGTSPAASPSSW
ncbi:MAG: GH92 family glycosyl hydrolase [Kiritimatiellae bacterium]|nr:GH92 family glycosyl hydrolase [Kiritimatiellia bacterium]